MKVVSPSEDEIIASPSEAGMIKEFEAKM